jgi:hypothetical protein
LGGFFGPGKNLGPRYEQGDTVSLGKCLVAVGKNPI